MYVAFGCVAVVHDYIREDGDFVIGDGNIGQGDGWEGEAFSVVVEAFGLDDRVAAGDGEGDGHVNGVCVAGAGGCAGDLVDGEIVAGALEAALHEDGGGVTVPVYGAAFEFVHAPGGAGDGGFVGGWEIEPACWTAEREVAVANVAVEGVRLGWAGPVDGSQGEFADSSVHGGALVTDWVAKAWLAGNGYPFVVDISVD